MKRVLITGANKGIGLATVQAVLEEEKDTFVFLGSRSEERGEAARKGLVDDHPAWEDRVRVLPIDVSSEDSVNAASIALARQADGSLYGLINNAGIGTGADMASILDVNVRGPKRVCEAFLPLIQGDGRIVNITSASGPNFVAECSDERQQELTDPWVTWAQIQGWMETCLAIEEDDGDFEAAGFGTGDAYGLSKACLNAYTQLLARKHPQMTINACTPGFIETDLTRSYAEQQGKKPEEMGMKPPSHGAKTPTFLLLGDPGGSGWYFGSDQKRSPLDRYRAPGDPPFTG